MNSEKPRYYLKSGEDITGPHDPVETFLMWQAGKLRSLNEARREDLDGWLPLSAVLERDGFDIKSTRRPKGDAVITMADVEAKRKENAARQAALDAIPECPMCHRKSWMETEQGNTAFQIIGAIVFILFAVPAGCSLLASGVSKSIVPLISAAILLGIPIIIFGAGKRRFKQCCNCQYRYQIK